MKAQTFESLPINASFRFAKKSKVAVGKYNGTMRKINSTEYRGECFRATPEPSILVIQMMKFNEIIGNENEGTMRYKNLSPRQARHLLALRTYVRQNRDIYPKDKILTNILASMILIAEDKG